MKNNFDVICIGAALIDMVAQVERYPEDDDEVFVSDLKLLSGGAAANTAYACARLGLKTAFIGKVGKNDIFGLKIVNDFNEVGVNTDLLKYSNNRRTGSAYVALNREGDRRIYAHSGAANYLSREDIKENELSLGNIIFLSSLKNIDPFVEAAIIGRNRKIPVILNPGMLIIDQEFINIKILLEKIDILILSRREFKTLFNVKKAELKLNTVREQADNLFSLGISVIVITKGNKGALIITPKNTETVPSIKINNVVDTTGAGDAFSAGFIYGFVQNQSFEFEDLKRNVRLGNFIAGKCIEQLGARNGIPKEEEIKFGLN
jgi:ribokinase